MSEWTVIQELLHNLELLLSTFPLSSYLEKIWHDWNIKQKQNFPKIQDLKLKKKKNPPDLNMKWSKIGNIIFTSFGKILSHIAHPHLAEITEIQWFEQDTLCHCLKQTLESFWKIRSKVSSVTKVWIPCPEDNFAMSSFQSQTYVFLVPQIPQSQIVSPFTRTTVMCWTDYGEWAVSFIQAKHS